MKKLILIGGDLAGGKSSYSRILSQEYRISLINKDNLKEILGDCIHVDTREENKRLSYISFQIMKYIVKQNQTILILESNFKQYEIEELNQIIEEQGYEVLSLRFIGDNEILHKRFLKRLEENRHYVHKSQDFTDINDFINTLNELRKVEYPKEVINVCCSNFDYQQDMTLRSKIEEFILAK